MRTFSRTLMALAIAGLFGIPALAQPPGGGGGPRGPRGGGMNLLDNKSVQEELKLSKEQIDKSKAAHEEIRKKHDEDFKKAREMSDEERRELFKKVNDENMKAISGILNEDQLKRYKQIQLQQSTRFMGPGTLLQDDVQKTLKLTDDQIAKIKTISEDVQKEMRELREGGFKPENFQKMQALSKDGLDKASATLTDDQKKSWKDMLGSAFEVKFDFPPRRQPPPQDK